MSEIWGEGGPEVSDPGRAEGFRLLRHAAAEPDAWALFLDIDGTLLDIAETPDGVVVPPTLIPSLCNLQRHFGGAVALVTGRTCDWASRRLAPLRVAVAGLHGAQRLLPDGTLRSALDPRELDPVREQLARASGAGLLVEDKGPAIALHFRSAPGLRGEAEAVMQEALDLSGEGWELQHGKMVIELRPANADKGQAVAEFLSEPPFRGRRPLAIGDDLTDEAMFARVSEHGGWSIRVGSRDRPTKACAYLPAPDVLRQALEEMPQWAA